MKNSVFRRLSTWAVWLWRRRIEKPREADPETARAEKILREAGPEHPVLWALLRLAEEQYVAYLSEAVNVKASDAERARTAAEAGAMLTFMVGVEETRHAKTEDRNPKAEA